MPNNVQGLIVSFVAVLLLVLVLVGNTVTGPSSASALRKKEATPVSDFMNKLPTEWSEVDVVPPCHLLPPVFAEVVRFAVASSCAES